MPKGFRTRKKPSKGVLERRVEELTEALEDIADILEDVGILEPPDIEDEPEDDPEPIIEGQAEKVEEVP